MTAWLLPENVEDVLPPQAWRMEDMRRALLDLFRGRGYQLVIPPLMEYVDSLLTGVGADLDLKTFKLVDQLTGRLMGVRADITPQVARIDAHLLTANARESPVLRGQRAAYPARRFPSLARADPDRRRIVWRSRCRSGSRNPHADAAGPRRVRREDAAARHRSCRGLPCAGTGSRSVPRGRTSIVRGAAGQGQQRRGGS